jgi:hypothetical protein
VAERQTLRDAIRIGFIHHLGSAKRSAALGTFAGKQVPVAVILKRLATDFFVLIPFGRRIQSSSKNEREI